MGLNSPEPNLGPRTCTSWTTVPIRGDYFGDVSSWEGEVVWVSQSQPGPHTSMMSRWWQTCTLGAHPNPNWDFLNIPKAVPKAFRYAYGWYSASKGWQLTLSKSGGATWWWNTKGKVLVLWQPFAAPDGQHRNLCKKNEQPVQDRGAAAASGRRDECRRVSKSWLGRRITLLGGVVGRSRWAAGW